MSKVQHLLKGSSMTFWKQLRRIRYRKIKWVWFSMMNLLMHRLWCLSREKMSESRRRTTSSIMILLRSKKNETTVKSNGNPLWDSSKKNAKTSSSWWTPKTIASESLTKMLPHLRFKCSRLSRRFIIQAQTRSWMAYLSLTIEPPQTCLALTNKASRRRICCRRISIKMMATVPCMLVFLLRMANSLTKTSGHTKSDAPMKDVSSIRMSSMSCRRSWRRNSSSLRSSQAKSR